MRKVLGLVGATLLFAGPALAADLGRPPPLKAAPLLPVFSWTGLYLGVHGGYGWSSSDVFGLGVLNNLKGGFAGGQIGYNYQINNFVLGIEGDGAWADISQSFDGLTFKFDAQSVAEWMDGRSRHRIRVSAELERQGRILALRVEQRDLLWQPWRHRFRQGRRGHH